MTVRYLKRNSTASAPPPPPPGPEVYAAGYRRCIGQVQELLAEQWTDERRQISGQRMIEHLESCARRLNNAPANRLSSSSLASSSDEPPNTNVTVVIMNNTNVSSLSSSCSSEDDDSNAATELRRDDTPAKLMWRPWWQTGYYGRQTRYHITLVFAPPFVIRYTSSRRNVIIFNNNCMPL